MGLPKRESLSAQEEILGKALTAERGLRLSFESQTTLREFRRRCYQLRVIDRMQNLKAYGVSSSEYDKLVFNIVGETTLIIMHGTSPGLRAVEEL